MYLILVQGENTPYRRRKFADNQQISFFRGHAVLPGIETTRVRKGVYINLPITSQVKATHVRYGAQVFKASGRVLFLHAY